MSLTATPEWFFAAGKRFPIQAVHTGLTYSNVAAGTLEIGLPFVAPASDGRAMFIAASSYDTAFRRIADIDWGADFALQREAEFEDNPGGLSTVFVYSQIWRAIVPAVHGDSANLVLTLNATGSIDLLAITIFGAGSVDSIAAVDDNESQGSVASHLFLNVATTADGFGLGSVAMLDNTSSVSSFSGNGSTGGLASVERSTVGNLAHHVFLGATPNDGTTEDFTASFSPSADSAATIATFK